MSKIDHGGPAFPIHPQPGVPNPPEWSGGMSLRDWFAGQALTEIMRAYRTDNKCGIGVEHFPRNCAAHAYAMADAMLAERSKP